MAIGCTVVYNAMIANPVHSVEELNVGTVSQLKMTEKALTIKEKHRIIHVTDNFLTCNFYITLRQECPVREPKRLFVGHGIPFSLQA